jgi:putative hydrolase of the HAD superfamily
MINDDQFLSQFGDLLGNSLSETELNDLWCSMLQDIPKHRIDWVIKLKQQFNVVLLSNTNAIHIRKVNEILKKSTEFQSLDEVFHNVYYSYEIHERKPDRAIYEHVLKDLNIPSEASVLFDDSKDNLDAAADLGIGTVYVEQNQLTIEHLPYGG